eukprot:FR741881.1.p2 GENE.FR741881.1~~FR741881.1.p2  ORF type:complete len:105 (-),score=19.33 FR741881.1:663-977(-)
MFFQGGGNLWKKPQQRGPFLRFPAFLLALLLTIFFLGFSPDSGDNRFSPFEGSDTPPRSRTAERSESVKRGSGRAPNTQTASPRALADSLMQLARQVSRLESGQ